MELHDMDCMDTKCHTADQQLVPNKQITRQRKAGNQKLSGGGDDVGVMHWGIFEQVSL